MAKCEIETPFTFSFFFAKQTFLCLRQRSLFIFFKKPLTDMMSCRFFALNFLLTAARGCRAYLIE